MKGLNPMSHGAKNKLKNNPFNVGNMDKVFYESIEEIIEYGKANGYEPKINHKWENDIEGETVLGVEIDFYLPDGSSPFSRTYDKWKNKPWEYAEESY